VGKYNAGMRGGKSRLTEGGHRVPCFLRWPAGGLDGGREVGGLTQAQDLLPTLLELCGVPVPPAAVFDGLSLATALRGERTVPDRTLVVQYGEPLPFRMTCVMRDRWRLLTDIKGMAGGEPELYDLASDPLQQTNLLAVRPEIGKQLRAAYEAWWAGTEPLTRERACLSIGHPDQKVSTLSSGEWREHAMHSMSGLREGVTRRGVWDVDVIRDGLYEFALRRWPEASGLALCAAAPAWTPRDTATPEHAMFPRGRALPIARAHLRVGDATVSREVQRSQGAAIFRVPLKAGRTEVEGWFNDAADDPLCAAFFVSVRRVR
jgi:hypothetical protein